MGNLRSSHREEEQQFFAVNFGEIALDLEIALGLEKKKIKPPKSRCHGQNKPRESECIILSWLKLIT